MPHSFIPPLLSADEPSAAAVEIPHGKAPFCCCAITPARRYRNPSAISAYRQEIERHRLGYRRAERVAPSEPPAGRDADPSALFAVGDRLQPGARHRQLDPALVRADADPRQYRYRRRTRAGARARGVLPYHHAIDDHLGQRQLRELPTAVIAMHSFTPVFKGNRAPGRWGCCLTATRSLPICWPSCCVKKGFAGGHQRTLCNDGRHRLYVAGSC